MRPLKAILAMMLLGAILVISGCSQDSSDSNQAFPNKSLKLIVSYSPGGGTDTQARIIAKYAKKYLGQDMIVVNKPGGGGQVGWNYFSNVKKNGYILSAYNLPHIITQPMAYDTYSTDDFEPIVNWGYDPTVFAVKKNSPFKTLSDVIQYAKEHPGSVTIGHSGKYVGQHMAILQLEEAAGIDLKAIAFKGASKATASLLGGHIDVVSGNLSGMHRRNDDVRILAVASEKRHHFEPDVPTFKELGYPSVIMSTDRGIAAVKGTPKPIIKKLEHMFHQLLQDKQFQKEMKKAGADLMIMKRDEVMKVFERRTKKYEELLKTIHAK
ncbi:tripartite tricarboxylate transporter substrate binding protein [Tuberibacillus sp. Marseille-P3662]|uniref:tripartite tricarboxylate transporter substrate binding protein n=1 Tax=Tuberibacillus sp. Marseille-P3662 TaxID=1965358 RepID=UPI000A1CA0C2|nr:tripartite tricarboxylate transporter substrate binding protein [Tuberibacillus sp. Marseille-P3662]